MNNNKIIIFRIDNIGDFLITTTLIDSVKKKFPDKAITIVCSERNFKIAKLYNSISNIIVYEKKYNFLKKIKIYYSILKNKYHASFAIDGKKFSILNTILMKSKFKFLIKYKKTKKILGINVERTRPSGLMEKAFFTNVRVFDSANYTSPNNHLPTLYSDLLKEIDIDISCKDPYVFPVEEDIKKKYEDFYKKNINEKFFIIHLDEKWEDLDLSENRLLVEITNLQKEINKVLVITSYKNNSNYYLSIKNNFKLFDFSNDVAKSVNATKNNKVIILEDLSLSLFERFIANSEAVISCHTAYATQFSGCSNTKAIDLINYDKKDWYNCWIPKNTSYHRIYKSDLETLFKNIKNKLIEIL